MLGITTRHIKWSLLLSIAFGGQVSLSLAQSPSRSSTAASKSSTSRESAAVPETAGVEWLRSAHEAAELSRETGKPIMVYVRSETCHFCDLMQSDVWEDSKVAQIVMRQYVPLKLTREENPEAVAAMKIKGFPATLLFSSDYAYIGRLDGYMKSAPFLQAISKMGTVASNDPSRWR